jgi:hypothetical protein
LQCISSVPSPTDEADPQADKPTSRITLLIGLLTLEYRKFQASGKPLYISICPS